MELPNHVTNIEFLASYNYLRCYNFWTGVGFESIAVYIL